MSVLSLAEVGTFCSGAGVIFVGTGTGVTGEVVDVDEDGAFSAADTLAFFSAFAARAAEKKNQKQSGDQYRP